MTRFVGFMCLSCWSCSRLLDACPLKDLAVVAFTGILFCLWTLGRQTWTIRQIVWLML